MEFRDVVERPQFERHESRRRLSHAGRSKSRISVVASRGPVGDLTRWIAQTEWGTFA
jgi:hypothetical protein